MSKLIINRKQNGPIEADELEDIIAKIIKNQRKLGYTNTSTFDYETLIVEDDKVIGQASGN